MTGRPEGAPDDLPVLWHLKVSHYNEKARWALDYKGVPHARRALDARLRIAAIARRLSGGDDVARCSCSTAAAIGDSTRDHRGARAPPARTPRSTRRTRTSARGRSSSRSSSTRSSARTRACSSSITCSPTPS